jgi:hypothetical protein
VLCADSTTLRFLGLSALAGFLSEAGFTVEAQYGDWRLGRVTASSPEIVTLARA